MEIKSPTPINLNLNSSLKTVFLAGSIEQGAAENWQDVVVRSLSQHFNVLNPRRDDWDASWVQTIENGQFRSQVEWELYGLSIADYIIMYFAPNTKSPITLLEFGLYASSNKLVVCCPKEYWRKGNVDIVCEKYKISMYPNLVQIISYLYKMINKQEKWWEGYYK